MMQAWADYLDALKAGHSKTNRNEKFTAVTDYDDDERGLFLLVPPTSARLWRMRYKIGGREKLLALGEWPHTSLKRARERRDEVRRLLADGIDPAAKKEAERRAIADTFSALAREYLDTKRSAQPKDAFES